MAFAQMGVPPYRRFGGSLDLRVWFPIPLAGSTPEYFPSEHRRYWR